MIPVALMAQKMRNQMKEAKVPLKPDAEFKDVDPNGGPRRYVNGVSITVFTLLLVAAAIFVPFGKLWIALGLALLSVLALFGVKIANQWEKAVVLRFGKFQALRGPGLFVVIPVIDRDLAPDRSAHARDGRDRRIGADPRHGPGRRRRHRLLDGLGCAEMRCWR